MPYVKTTKIRDMVFCNAKKPELERQWTHPLMMSLIVTGIFGAMFMLGIVGVRTTLAGNYSVVKAFGYAFIPMIGIVYVCLLVSQLRRKKELKRISEERPSPDSWYVLHYNDRGWLVFRNGWMVFECERYMFRLSPTEIGDVNRALAKWANKSPSELVLSNGVDGYRFYLRPLIIPKELDTKKSRMGALKEAMLEWSKAMPRSGVPLLPPLPASISEGEFRSLVARAIRDTMIVAIPPGIVAGAMMDYIQKLISDSPTAPLQFGLSISVLIACYVGVIYFSRLSSVISNRKFNREFAELARSSKVEVAEQWEEQVCRQR